MLDGRFQRLWDDAVRKHADRTFLVFPRRVRHRAGAINLTRLIARQVGSWGITCNAVGPGPVATP